VRSGAAHGLRGFDYDSAHAIFDEHARLSGWRNGEDGAARVFDISGLTGMSRQAYDALEPIQWPVRRRYGRPARHARLFADGRFAHATARRALSPRRRACPCMRSTRTIRWR
jgi:assimilatory nitrate reductase catalytic subunit